MSIRDNEILFWLFAWGTPLVILLLPSFVTWLGWR